MGNTMRSLVDTVSSNIDQQVPMDSLNCVRLALECWPRIDVIIERLKRSHESSANVHVLSPQVSSFCHVIAFLIESVEITTGHLFRGLARAFSMDFFIMQFHVCSSNCISGFISHILSYSLIQSH
jgi:hypothetical protein